MEDLKKKLSMKEEKALLLGLDRGGIKYLLKGFKASVRDLSSTKRVFDWKENGSLFRLFCITNKAGRYIMSRVSNVNRKRHNIYVPTVRGLIKG